MRPCSPARRFSCPPPAGEGKDAVVNQILAGCRKLMEDKGLSREDIAGVGIGSPGPLSPSRGVIYRLPNLPGMENLPMCELVSKGLDMPVWLENDANAAALGEFLCGAGMGKPNMINAYPWHGPGRWNNL